MYHWKVKHHKHSLSGGIQGKEIILRIMESVSSAFHSCHDQKFHERMNVINHYLKVGRVEISVTKYEEISIWQHSKGSDERETSV